jgi:membrane protease YdiL (CAAX protease family)
MRKIFQTQASPPWSYLTALGAMIAMFLAVIIGTTIAQTLLGNDFTALIAGWSVGMMLTAFFVTFTRRAEGDTRALRLDADDTRLPLVALFALGMAIAFDLVGWVVTGEQTLASAELLRLPAADLALFGWVILLLFLIVFQPVAEELVFRGMMFPALASTVGPLIGFFAVSLFHGFFHLLAYTPTVESQTVAIWYGLILPVLDGIVFTAVRAHTGSTRASIVAHAVFGIFALIKVITFS